jgi:hypothetical protein
VATETQARHQNTKNQEMESKTTVDGSTMKQRKHYNLTYAPVARWNSIRLMLSLAALKQGWKTTQLDYVLAFPRAPVERDLYTEIPKGFILEDLMRQETMY